MQLFAEVVFLFGDKWVKYFKEEQRCSSPNCQHDITHSDVTIRCSHKLWPNSENFLSLWYKYLLGYCFDLTIQKIASKQFIKAIRSLYDQSILNTHGSEEFILTYTHIPCVPLTATITIDTWLNVFLLILTRISDTETGFFFLSDDCESVFFPLSFRFWLWFQISERERQSG